MTSEGFGEMFEDDSADTCANKIQLMSMGCLAEGLVCADPGAKTPNGLSEKKSHFITIFANIVFSSNIPFLFSIKKISNTEIVLHYVMACNLH